MTEKFTRSELCDAANAVAMRYELCRFLECALQCAEKILYFTPDGNPDRAEAEHRVVQLKFALEKEKRDRQDFMRDYFRDK